VRGKDITTDFQLQNIMALQKEKWDNNLKETKVIINDRE
jgi:hypothetical protein